MGLKSLQLGQQVLQGEGCEGHTWGSDPREHLQGAVRRWVRAQTLGAGLHVAGWGAAVDAQPSFEPSSQSCAFTDPSPEGGGVNPALAGYSALDLAKSLSPRIVSSNLPHVWPELSGVVG